MIIKRLRVFLLIMLFAVSQISASDDMSTRIAALRATADSLHVVGRTDSAAVVGSEAMELALRSGDKVAIVGTNAAQGVFLRSLGQIDEALACYNRALEIVTSEGFRGHLDQEAIEEVASLYINMAVLNLDMGNKDDAAMHALLSAEWTAKCDDSDIKSQIYGVVGSILTAMSLT